VGAGITSISANTAQTTVTFDPGGLAAGKSTQMTYDPSNDVITYLGATYCGTNAPRASAGRDVAGWSPARIAGSVAGIHERGVGFHGGEDLAGDRPADLLGDVAQ
jgi:hypothetical protein